MEDHGSVRRYAVCGAVAVGVYLSPALDAVQLGDAVLYDLIGLSAVPAILWGVHRHRPAARAPWLLLALGQLLFVLGDANQVFYDVVLHREPPVPSFTDLFWLPAYPILAAVLVMLLRAQRRGSDRSALIDSTILSTAFGLLVWIYIIAPVTADGTLGTVERVLAAVYPVLDLLLLAAVARLAIGGRRRNAAQQLLTASMVGVFVGDCLYSQQLLGEGLVGPVVYPLWLGAYLAAGAAALHPSMAAASRDDGPPADPGPGRTSGAVRLRVVGACSLLAPLVLLVQWLRGDALHVPIVVGASTLLFLLVVARLSGMASEAELLTGRLVEQRGERRLAALVEGAADVVLVVDAAGRIIYETPSVNSVLGFAPGQLLNGPLTGLFSPDEALELRSPRGGGVANDAEREFRARTGKGQIAVVGVLRRDHTDNPDIGGIVLTIRDVRERKQLQDRLQYQATHDALTGLPNRRRFEEQLTAALREPSRGALTLLYLDLDDFKAVNDSLGHQWGDRLLSAVTDRLRAELREQDTLCRLGGDEFVLLLPDSAVAQGCAVAQRLLDTLAEPLDLTGRTVRTGASIGVVTAEPGTALRAEELLAAADTAMYAAKRSGRGSWALFQDDMHTQLLRRAELEAELRTALDRRSLHVAYQPLVRLADNAVVGFEALVRWQSPVLGSVSPSEFIPLAEETGLIGPLGRQVLSDACAFLTLCNADRTPDTTVRMAVNVSVRQLQEPDFVATVQAVLAAAGVPAHLLTLEITESVRLFDGSAQVLARLKAIGVRLALDDFGTGYAALTHITTLPIDEIKIDRSFVSALEQGGRQARLTESVVRLGQHLRLEVVAEGIETDGQAALLLALGCDLAQGYLFGRPQPADEARRLLTGSAVTGYSRPDRSAPST